MATQVVSWLSIDGKNYSNEKDADVADTVFKLNEWLDLFMIERGDMVSRRKLLSQILIDRALLADILCVHE